MVFAPSNIGFAFAKKLYKKLRARTPISVQIFLLYYGFFMGVGIDRFIAAFLAIGLKSAAYQAEYFRGAIESISKGLLTYQNTRLLRSQLGLWICWLKRNVL